MDEELKTPSIVVVLMDDGITPLQTIGYDNFISYKYINENKLEVAVNTINFPHKNYQETYVQFEITPYNKHVLRAVEYWSNEKKV